MARAYLSIGSNIAREQNIGLALKRLRQRYRRLELSSVYEAEPIGFEGRHFYNVAASFDSEESPAELIQVFRAIEQESGRSRKGPKFGPRTLDLDLLLFGGLVCEHNGLKLPRDEITRYAFVLRPLAEIAGELRHPTAGKTIAQLWAEFDDSQQPTRRLRKSVDQLLLSPPLRQTTGRANGSPGDEQR